MDSKPEESVDPTELVQEMLDEFGKSISSDLFGDLIGSIDATPRGSPSDLARLQELLGIRLGFVIDACAVQRLLRYRLRGRRSGLLDALKAEFIRLEAPQSLDVEIAEHAADIGRDCRASPMEVLEDYFTSIRPHIYLEKNVDQDLLASVAGEIRDPEDAPFVAVYLEHGALGVITYDEDIRSFPQTRCFTISEVAEIHVTYRKQIVVFTISAPAIAVACGFVMVAVTLARSLLRILKLAATYPKATAAILAIGGLVYLSFREPINAKFRELGVRWGSLKASVLPFLREVRPILFALLSEYARRVDAAQEQSRRLRLPGRGGRRRRRARGVMRGQSTIAHFAKCVLLAHQGPLPLRGLADAIRCLGYKTGARDFARSVRTSLLRSPEFVRLPEGSFQLSSWSC